MASQWIRTLALLNLSFTLPQCAPTLAGTLVDPLSEQPAFTDGHLTLTSLSKQKNADSHIAPVAKDGRFRFEKHLEAGNYRLDVLIPGYRTLSRKLELPTKEDLAVVIIPLQENHIPLEVSTSDIPAKAAGNVSITPPHF